MKIITARKDEKEKWNRFVADNFPPIGAFMQTWEWGEFKQALGRRVNRYFVHEGGKPIAAFMIVHHALPMGLSYGYAPRGPVIIKNAGETKTVEILKIIKKWAEAELSHFIFLRLEPPTGSNIRGLKNHGFHIPAYYIQPRYNTAVPLNKSEEEIRLCFHPSTRSNISRALKRGVVAEVRNEITDADREIFYGMTEDTIRRHKGTDAYPSRDYFSSLFKTIPLSGKVHGSSNLSLGAFYGYQNNEPAAIHFVLFFGDTVTYLYGASYRRYLNSKVMTYLHWEAIKEAKRSGSRYYDLGGIDETRWKTLTDFKRQFRGEEFCYMGNIDIVLKPVLYKIYNLFRIIRK
ncbi:MAG: peptidoglycan bridge formation glycyltransferase FemA/FemB family protein [Candidatus Paceibacterota bacterium]|jgi:lipid II:glycine glycyltransferase (peptidoglycan interpeptide bridge formation enzyme)